MKLFNSLLISVVLLSLSACGYHLRGSSEGGQLNISKVKLEMPGINRIRQELQDQLIVRDIEILNEESEVERIIALKNERYVRRVLSVDETTGKVTEYELEYIVYLQIFDAQRKALMPLQRISMIRDVTFDPEALIGKGAEERLLYEDMIRNAANTILYRLQAVGE